MPLRLRSARLSPLHVAVLAVVLGAVTGCQTAAAGPRPTAAGPSQSAPSQPAPSQATQDQAAPGRTPGASPAAGTSPRIMIVGDSITEGSAGDYTWQFRLYEHLRADGISPRMVGPYSSLYNNVTNAEGDQSYADPRFERANDARWGLTLFREKDAIGGNVATYRPDYLLVLLGLDDISWYGLSQPVMASNLAGFIAAARAARPGIRIVLGLIPPNIHEQTNPALAANIASYNHTIALTAGQLSTKASPIAVAADGAQINVAADLWDGTHPNANGEIKIAAAFADVLASRFGLGTPYRTPYPVLPTGPLTPPRLTVTPSATAHQAKLSWTLSPGAESYYIYLKDQTQAATEWTRLPLPLTPAHDPFTAGLLTSGDTYAFKVQACKGHDCGAFSNPVSVTAP